LNLRIEQDTAQRESFGPYTYNIYEGDQLVARFWHDYRGDEPDIELFVGRKRDWPFARMTYFIEGGGPEPLRLSDRAIAYLEACFAEERGGD